MTKPLPSPTFYDKLNQNQMIKNLEKLNQSRNLLRKKWSWVLVFMAKFLSPRMSSKI